MWLSQSEGYDLILSRKNKMKLVSTIISRHLSLYCVFNYFVKMFPLSSIFSIFLMFLCLLVFPLGQIKMPFLSPFWDWVKTKILYNLFQIQVKIIILNQYCWCPEYCPSGLKSGSNHTEYPPVYFFQNAVFSSCSVIIVTGYNMFCLKFPSEPDWIGKLLCLDHLLYKDQVPWHDLQNKCK